MTLSTVEIEYIAATATCTQIMWMRRQLQDLGIQNEGPLSIFCDNVSAINLSKNPVQHSKSKYIDIRYHFLKDQVACGEVKLEFVPTSDQVANIFTKPVPRENFEGLREKLGVCSTPSH